MTQSAKRPATVPGLPDYPSLWQCLASAITHWHASRKRRCRLERMPIELLSDVHLTARERSREEFMRSRQ